MQKCVLAFNVQADEGNAIDLDSAKDPTGDVFAGSTDITAASDVPVTLRGRLVELVLLKNHCEKEVALVVAEMHQFLLFLHKQKALIPIKIGTIGNSSLDQGLKSLLVKKRILLNNKQFLTQQLCGKSGIFSPYMCVATVPFRRFGTIEIEEMESDDAVSTSGEEDNCDRDLWDP